MSEIVTAPQRRQRIVVHIGVGAGAQRHTQPQQDLRGQQTGKVADSDEGQVSDTERPAGQQQCEPPAEPIGEVTGWYFQRNDGGVVSGLQQQHLV